ncbi:MAG: SurA N-terminal domain-containing protein [Thermodesulfobacteriota bacterium]
MLQFMRQKASSWIIKALLSLIVLAFIISMGVGSYRNRDDIAAAATVNGEEISVTQFQERYYVLLDNVRQQFGNQLNEELLKMMNLKERALDQLISETLLVQKAKELGFDVSDRELSRSIKEMSLFQRDGKFNKAQYNGILQRNRLTPEIFEQQLRRDMLTRKVRDLITDNIKVSEDEARRWYDWQHSKIKIKVAVFGPENFLPLSPSEDEIGRYFTENKGKYKSGEKLEATYLRFNPDDYISRAAVDDAAIQQYYDDHQDIYQKEKTVDVSHILFKVDENASQETAAAKETEATKVYDMVTSGQDFAACAKQYSEDTSSSAGGKLGTFTREELVAPFADQAFSMEAGEISRPVRTLFGWHIIKLDRVTEASVTPLETVRVNINKTLAQKQARDLAHEEALRLFDAAINKNSVKEAAEQNGMTPQTTPLFSMTDRLEGIPGDSEFIRQAFDLQENEISDVVEINGSYYLLQVNRRLAPEEPELVAVRDKVVADLAARMRRDEAEKAANAFLNKLQAGTGMDQAAEEAHTEIIATGYFGRGENVPELGREAELSQEAQALNSQDRFVNKVIAGQDGKYYVVWLEDRKGPEQDAFSRDKESIMSQLVQAKKQEIFNSWLSSMKAQSEITQDDRILKR